METPSQAREFAARCVDVPSVHFAALDKLNAMPLPADIPVFIKTAADSRPGEKITFAMDVFFDVDEAYPVPLAFDKLRELVIRIAGTGTLDVVIISSSENAFERGASRDVAQLRTDLVRRYLLAAGVDARRIYGTTQAPDHDDTPEGRARDRSARIEVVMHRQKSLGSAAAAQH